MDEKKVARALDACQAFIVRIDPTDDELKIMKQEAFDAISAARGDSLPPLGVHVSDAVSASGRMV